MDPGSKEFRRDFVRSLVGADLESGKHARIVTRFPPEPNGYLHVGHAKSICLNFGIALETGGQCNMRFDDTNPEKESDEYVRSILEDVRWLGFEWGGGPYYASDYFETIFAAACELVEKGLAYVDEQTADEIRAARGTLTEAGSGSKWRERPASESLIRLDEMRAGALPDGACVLRARIDMASPNINLRDPSLLRIRRATHHRTGDQWCVYPMYDFAHPISDALEGITHSICTLEFEDHRPLYDWVVANVTLPSRPRQIEFARLELTHTILSKRKLLELVKEGHVAGWDDPRMPTLAGMRRRGVPPEALRDFCERVGVAKANSVVDMALLEHCVRENLNLEAPRYMGVLRPLKVVIENYPEDGEEWLPARNNPEDPSAGTREVPFARELWIERDDFRIEPGKKFWRLAVGREVRLRWAYFITCTRVEVDPATGEPVLVRCTYDPSTRGGDSPDGRKVKATLHWVSVRHAGTAEVRLYDRLFSDMSPGDDWRERLNADSLEVLQDCPVEPALAQIEKGARVQLERVGYFCVDARDSRVGRPALNRIVGLKGAATQT